ncbi:hypothetical protein LHK22_14070 [Staphylococcus argenteus]|nr:hypothetical protein [Staphylococcus argenteus]MCG9825306.1 hypothetical protein [Staphylococcus argenteus]
MIQDIDWDHINEIELSLQHQRMGESYIQSQLIGTFDELKQQLTDLANDLEVDELMISTTQFGATSRQNLYQSLSTLIDKQ